MEVSLIELLLNEVPQALCNVQESEARVSFYALPNGEVRMAVDDTISEEHTRRSQTLHDALPEENVRYMIQQCLQKQPNKKWQAIGINMYGGEQRLNDVVLIHHYYSKKSKSLKLTTETMRLNMLPSSTSQTFQMQQIVSVVDSTFKNLFTALNYSYTVHSMTTVTSKDVKNLEKYLISSASKFRPVGLLTMREIAADIFGGETTISTVSMSLMFALLSTVLMNVIDTYESLRDVEKRLHQILATQPEIYILMLSDMKERLSFEGHGTAKTGSTPTDTRSSISSISKYIQFPSDTDEGVSWSESDIIAPAEDSALKLNSDKISSSNLSVQPEELLDSSQPLLMSDVIPTPDEPLPFTEDNYIDAVDTEPLTDTILPDFGMDLRVRVRHPITGRCLHVGGRSFQRAVDQYGIETIKKWSIC